MATRRNALTKLADAFTVEEGQFWIGAGIQFISFGFITGRVVVAIAFGHKFSFTILGMASFSLEPIAYIEIGILTTVDEEKFVLRASLSPNSYILHPDIFSLQGDIALCAWYAKPHKGDFLFSIGGYHPEFKKPEHYPELVRVGAKASLYDFVHLSVEVFFACTPQALMAGAKAAFWAEFMGIAAGCEVYVDVLITWDPFFLRAGIGVVLWFEFFGRHEIGVHLDIYTPEFGGTATIDLAIVSFEVSFGDELDVPPAPSIAEFMVNQLALPATDFHHADTLDVGARVPRFNTEESPGLLRLEFLSGRVGAVAPEESEPQEGTDATAPVHLGPEWSFLVRTRFPLDVAPEDVPPGPSMHPRVITGAVNLPLCQRTGLASRLAVVSPTLDDPDVSDAIGCVWLTDFHPAATFGPDELASSETGSQAVATLDSKNPSVSLGRRPGRRLRARDSGGTRPRGLACRTVEADRALPGAARHRRAGLTARRCRAPRIPGHIADQGEHARRCVAARHGARRPSWPHAPAAESSRQERRAAQRRQAVGRADFQRRGSRRRGHAAHVAADFPGALDRAATGVVEGAARCARTTPCRGGISKRQRGQRNSPSARSPSRRACAAASAPPSRCPRVRRNCSSSTAGASPPRRFECPVIRTFGRSRSVAAAASCSTGISGAAGQSSYRRAPPRPFSSERDAPEPPPPPVSSRTRRCWR